MCNWEIMLMNAACWAADSKAAPIRQDAHTHTHKMRERKEWARERKEKKRKDSWKRSNRLRS